MNPTAIEADRARGVVSIEWEDGHRSEYSAAMLRWACPCALCKGEWGRPGVLASISSLPEEELTLTDVQAVGSYAIMPVWASGHAQGIYSWEYLRAICPCEECGGIHPHPPAPSPAHGRGGDDTETEVRGAGDHSTGGDERDLRLEVADEETQ